MLIVPMDTPGVEVVRDLPVFGRHDQHGHCVVQLTDVRVPVGNLLGEEGGGFAAAQARLGPGRIHHVMRALGAGERALAMMVSRAQQRVAFGGPLAEQSAVRERIAESRIELDQARALCHHAAYTVDDAGNKAARHLIAAAKVAVPRAVLSVIDRAIQLHGGAGITDATPLSMLYGWHRAMRIFDGPDEAHLTTLARAELSRPPIFDLPEGVFSQFATSGSARGPDGAAEERGAMRAVTCQKGVLDVADVADPVPERGHVVLEVHACGICGSDLHARHHCDEMADDAAATRVRRADALRPVGRDGPRVLRRGGRPRPADAAAAQARHARRVAADGADRRPGAHRPACPCTRPVGTPSGCSPRRRSPSRCPTGCRRGSPR